MKADGTIISSGEPLLARRLGAGRRPMHRSKVRLSPVSPTSVSIGAVAVRRPLSSASGLSQRRAANPLSRNPLVTFRVSRRRREMYCGHARLCACLSLCLSAAACLHYCTDSDVTWSSGRGCPLVVHCWADLQSVHGLRCHGNITRTRNVSEYMLVLALCLVQFVVDLLDKSNK